MAVYFLILSQSLRFSDMADRLHSEEIAQIVNATAIVVPCSVNVEGTVMNLHEDDDNGIVVVSKLSNWTSTAS